MLFSILYLILRVPDPPRHAPAKFSGPFDEVFGTEGLTVVKTPVRTPKANPVAERWVGSVRRECLDHVLIFGRRHLQRVLGAYAEHYNRARPHRGLDLQPPDPESDSEAMPGRRSDAAAFWVGSSTSISGARRDAPLPFLEPDTVAPDPAGNRVPEGRAGKRHHHLDREPSREDDGDNKPVRRSKRVFLFCRHQVDRAH